MSPRVKVSTLNDDFATQDAENAGNNATLTTTGRFNEGVPQQRQ
jgi:hypothetical protein